MKNKLAVLALSVAVFSIWACGKNDLASPSETEHKTSLTSRSPTNFTFTAVEITREEYEQEFALMLKTNSVVD